MTHTYEMYRQVQTYTDFAGRYTPLVPMRYHRRRRRVVGIDVVVIHLVIPSQPENEST